MFTNIILTNNFFSNNLWWIIAIGVALLIVLFIVIDVVVTKRKAKKATKAKQLTAQKTYLTYLGGPSNVIDSSLEGSRIVVHLYDYALIDREKLKEAGVSGFIEKSDKLTLVVPRNSEEIYNGIFKGGDAL